MTVTEWAAFYSVMATASAALLGLLFVAVSIGAPEALNHPRSTIRGLAEQSLQNYLLVLIVSCVALFPQTSPQAMGTAILSVSVSRIVWAVVRLVAMLRRSPERSATIASLRRQLVSLVGLACVLIAAARLALGLAEDLHLLASGALVLLASSAVSSWMLLLKLVQSRSGAPGPF